ncbi:hypothetical protein PV721_14110 [Streptomyces sp. MB09-01]|nr:hypothetical protein [Streptomyces sp. MB09-01]
MRSDGIHANFADATGHDIRTWVAASKLPDDTKRLVGNYVGRADVSAGFAGCATEQHIEPTLRVEVNLPKVSVFDDPGLAQQSRWAREILDAVEEFAHTFRPGYFVKDEGLFSGWEKRWVTDEEGGASCTGDISLWGYTSPVAVNIGKDYNQSENHPVK